MITEPSRSGDRIDEIATAFVKERLRGTSVSIESCLAAHPEIDREELLFELLLEEFEICGRKHQPISPADYARRLPELSKVVTAAYDQFCMGEFQSRQNGINPVNETPAAGVEETLADENHAAQLGENSATAPTLHDGGQARAPVEHGNAVGRYQLIRQLGRGGMGVVHLAVDPETSRQVALKVIHSGAFASEEERSRFRREAESMSRLNHSNIVPVYEASLSDSESFIAMQYVDGITLQQRIQQGLLEPRAAAQLIATLADAIQHAHDFGIIHRDLKPGNVLLEDNGENPFIVDFGLAVDTRASDQLTRTGATLGTPQFMSPEQANGGRVLSGRNQSGWAASAAGQDDPEAGDSNQGIGPYTDVYGLGALLYFVLSGKPPHQGVSHIEVIMRVLEQEPVSVDAAQPVPVELVTICEKSLQKNPAERYESAAKLAADLRRFLNNEPIEARRTSLPRRAYKWCQRNPWITRFLTLMLLVAIGSVYAAVEFQMIALKAEDDRNIANAATAEKQLALDSETRAKEEATRDKKIAQKNLRKAEDQNMSRLMAEIQGAKVALDFHRAQQLLADLERLENGPNATTVALMKTCLQADQVPQLVTHKKASDGHWEFSGADLHPDGRRLVTLDGGSLITVFDAKTFQKEHRLTRGLMIPVETTIGDKKYPKGHFYHFASLADDCPVPPVEPTIYSAVCWAGEGSSVVATQQDGRCVIFDADQPVGESSQPVRTLWQGDSSLTTVAAALDHSAVLVGDSAGQLTLLRTDVDSSANPFAATASVDNNNAMPAISCVKATGYGWLVGTQAGHLIVYDHLLNELDRRQWDAAIWSIDSQGASIAVAGDKDQVSMFAFDQSLRPIEDRRFQDVISVNDPLLSFVCVRFEEESLWAFDQLGRVYHWADSQLAERIGQVTPVVRRKEVTPPRSTRYRRVVFAEGVSDGVLVADQSGTLRLVSIKKPEPVPLIRKVELTEKKKTGESQIIQLGRNPQLARHSDNPHVIWAIDDNGQLTALTTNGEVIDRVSAFAAIDRSAVKPGTSKARHPAGTDLAVLKDGRVFTVGRENRVAVWKLENGRIAKQTTDYPAKHSLMSVSVSAACGKVAAVDVKSQLNIWDLNTGRRTHVVPINPDDPTPQEPLTGRCAFSDDGKLLAAFGSGQTSRVYDATRMEPTGGTMQVAGDGGTHVLWTAGKQGLLVLSDSRTSIVFDEQQRRISSSSYGGNRSMVALWHYEKGTLVSLDSSGILSCHSDGDGARLFALSTRANDTSDLLLVGSGELLIADRNGQLSRLEQQSSDDQLTSQRMTPDNMTKIVGPEDGYSSYQWIQLKRNSDGHLFGALASISAAVSSHRDLLWLECEDGEWGWDVVFSDPDRPLAHGFCGLTTDPKRVSFRVTTDAANYEGDLMLMTESDSGWNLETVARKHNLGFHSFIHESENRLQVISFDHEFRDTVIHTQANAGLQGWPMERALPKVGYFQPFYRANDALWLGGRTYRQRDDLMNKLHVYDQGQFISRQSPVDGYMYALDDNGDGDLDGLVQRFADKSWRIDGLRNEVWETLVEVPLVEGCSHDYRFFKTFADGTKAIFGMKFGQPVVLVFRNHNWKAYEVDLSMPVQGGGLCGYDVTDDGLVTLMLSAGPTGAQSLYAVEFSLP